MLLWGEGLCPFLHRVVIFANLTWQDGASCEWGRDVNTGLITSLLTSNVKCSHWAYGVCDTSQDLPIPGFANSVSCCWQTLGLLPPDKCMGQMTSCTSSPAFAPALFKCCQANPTVHKPHCLVLLFAHTQIHGQHCEHGVDSRCCTWLPSVAGIYSFKGWRDGWENKYSIAIFGGVTKLHHQR